MPIKSLSDYSILIAVRIKILFPPCTHIEAGKLSGIESSADSLSLRCSKSKHRNEIVRGNFHVNLKGADHLRSDLYELASHGLLRNYYRPESEHYLPLNYAELH